MDAVQRNCLPQSFGHCSTWNSVDYMYSALGRRDISSLMAWAGRTF